MNDGISNHQIARRDYRIGCDIGGTFTDFILLDEASGEIHLEKVLTTPADPSSAVGRGCELLAINAPAIIGQTRHMIHGTTLVINAVLERSGACTALVTTEGFRDVLEMRRYMRADMYDVFGDLPEPLVPRDMRFAVRERVYADGRVLTRLDEESVQDVIASLENLDVESVAVCLLHSYVNAEHERRVAELIRSALPDVDISLSSEVLPQISEYERTSSTVVNAYVQPLVRRYIERLQSQLSSSGVTENLFLMLSGGGITSAETARQFPVRLVESGPVAGVLAAERIGQLTGADDVLSFDMGGTTAKASLIQDGQVPIAADYEVDRANRARKGSGIPISLPTVDIIEVGTGGGSIAFIDELGMVKVGPRSAGAHPGPASYGLGGSEPTVTDADLVLGFLNPDFFLGGSMRLDRDAAYRAIEQRIAVPLVMDVTDAAWGIVDVAREQMATAMRMHIAERAGDPARTTIVASGGAGPVHAVGLMTKLRARQTVLPLGAGVMSALGLLMAPVSYNLVQTHKAPLNALELVQLETVFVDLEREGSRVLRQADPGGMQRFVRSLDMRYVGQGHELTIALSDGDLTNADPDTVLQAFYDEYRTRYGYVSTDSVVEIVNVQVRAIVDAAPMQLRRLRSTGRSVEAAIKGRRDAYDSARRSFIEHIVYDRYLLEPDMRFWGPAIVEERESTVVAGPGHSLDVDRYGSLVVTSSDA